MCLWLQASLLLAAYCSFPEADSQTSSLQVAGLQQAPVSQIKFLQPTCNAVRLVPISRYWDVHFALCGKLSGHHPGVVFRPPLVDE